VVQGREVHPNLVCAPGFQMDVEQAGGDECLNGVVVRDAVPPLLGDGELPVVAGVPSDRRVDGAAGRIRMALYQSVIALVDRASKARLSTVGASEIATNMTPDVPTSGATRCSLRSGTTGDAEPRRCQSAEHRWAGHPTDACAATPGLSTATMSASEYRIVMPSMSTGGLSGRKALPRLTEPAIHGRGRTCPLGHRPTRRRPLRPVPPRW
jgi:hypothetical protein